MGSFTQYEVRSGPNFPLTLTPPPQVVTKLEATKIFRDTLSSKKAEFIKSHDCKPTNAIYHACGINYRDIHGIKFCGGTESKIPGFPGICDQTFKITITRWEKPHKLE